MLYIDGVNIKDHFTNKDFWGVYSIFYELNNVNICDFALKYKYYVMMMMYTYGKISLWMNTNSVVLVGRGQPLSTQILLKTLSTQRFCGITHCKVPITHFTRGDMVHKSLSNFLGFCFFCRR